MRSYVFRDLFAFPQPSNKLLIEGCPSIHMSDTPVALKELLSALLRGHRCVGVWATLSAASFMLVSREPAISPKTTRNWIAFLIASA